MSSNLYLSMLLHWHPMLAFFVRYSRAERETSAEGSDLSNFLDLLEGNGDFFS